jgi:nucleoside-diphosphate-sugar epimerase
MRRAVVLGGTGVLGRAAAARLIEEGWDVDVTGRDSAHMPTELADLGARFVTSDRTSLPQLRAALGGGADLVVDCLCFTAADAGLLVPLLGDIGSTVMISSKGVYVDFAGRHSNSDDSPDFAGPITELQPTMSPGNLDRTSREGYGANKVAAERVLLDTGHPVSVLRPSKVHGVGAARPREWVFAKRALDQRPAVFLANRGAGIDHPTAAVNTAALISTVANKPGQRILNSADPDAPSALEISRTVAAALQHDREEILLDDDVISVLGNNPWNPHHPIVLDLSASLALGYEPVGTYAETVRPELDWLATADPAQLPAEDDPFFAQFFDYPAEDLYLDARRLARSLTI